MEGDPGTGVMDETNSEMEWLHRIDCHEEMERIRPELSFRSSDLSQVNASGGGSNKGGEETLQTKHNMPQAYAQCKAAREAKLKGKTVEISAVENFGCETIREGQSVGSFENNPEGLKGCYFGSRVQRGGLFAHQSLCTSFDPANLMCIACENEHKIFSGEKSICIVLSDQGFVGNLSGNGAGNCISVIRIEGGGVD